MQIDWLFLTATLLTAIGGIGSLLYGVRWFVAQRRAIEYDWVVDPDEATTATRSADAGPPPGAVDWVCDIIGAMSESQASCILEALEDSCSRDQARARRIEHLEARKWPGVLSQATTEHLATLKPQEPQT